MRRKERKGIWIPQSVLKLDLNGNDKILLAEIYSLCERKNGCYASNQHFANLIGYETAAAASKRLTFLAEKGLIRTKLVYDGKRCVGRNIYRNDIMNSLMGIVPNDNDGNDIGNQGVVPNEPQGISVGNTINSSSINSVIINSVTSADTIINTGVKKESITYGANDKLNCGGISQGQYYRNQKEEAYNKLVIATPIGKDIFNYASPNKFYALEKRIGFESFQQVKPLLIQYINAINQLG